MEVDPAARIPDPSCRRRASFCVHIAPHDDRTGLGEGFGEDGATAVAVPVIRTPLPS
jgi:hypothetical protein